ncbi:hypothetical protein BG015_011318 [Linnemannia schmuckeri]|uniref:Uncharacterized protein n=1 Tax=Linnemannia schmuckeri TaxID=64567 RepID=A0A9P5V8G4_9FUNG|nr:hypothetical protein BG015_011318 [Linnemannia schmuckeri]
MVSMAILQHNFTKQSESDVLDTTTELAVVDSLKDDEALNEYRIMELYLEKCVSASDEIMMIVEQFSDADIKYYGLDFAFLVFTSGNVYILQRAIKKSAKDRPLAWQQQQEVDEPSPSPPPKEVFLANLLLSESSSSPIDVDDGMVYFDMWIDDALDPHSPTSTHITTTVPTTTVVLNITAIPTAPTLPRDQHIVIPSSVQGAAQQRQVRPGKARAKAAPLKATVVTKSEPLLMMMDSGLGTFYLCPEQMPPLEESTLLSLEKLSMLDRSSPSER